jgi:hypothetical protein
LTEETGLVDEDRALLFLDGVDDAAQISAERLTISSSAEHALQEMLVERKTSSPAVLFVSSSSSDTDRTRSLFWQREANSRSSSLKALQVNNMADCGSD